MFQRDSIFLLMRLSDGSTIFMTQTPNLASGFLTREAVSVQDCTPMLRDYILALRKLLRLTDNNCRYPLLIQKIISEFGLSIIVGSCITFRICM